MSNNNVSEQKNPGIANAVCNVLTEVLRERPRLLDAQWAPAGAHDSNGHWSCAGHEPRYPKAAECLSKDKDALPTFYDFPAEHWIHLRTTNPIESTFCDGEAANGEDTQLRLPDQHHVDGVQAHQECRAALTASAGF